jgi:hypothetical protein
VLGSPRENQGFPLWRSVFFAFATKTSLYPFPKGKLLLIALARFAPHRGETKSFGEETTPSWRSVIAENAIDLTVTLLPKSSICHLQFKICNFETPWRFAITQA